MFETRKTPSPVCCATCNKAVRLRHAYLGSGAKPYCSLKCLIASGLPDRACSTCGSSVNPAKSIFRNRAAFCGSTCFRPVYH